MGLAESIWAYFRACPLIGTRERLSFNCLAAQTCEFAIDDEGPENPVVKSYMDGSSLRVKTFVLASRQSYGADARENLSKSGFFEQLAAWVEQQNRLHILPQMPEGQEPCKLEALTAGYLFSSEGDTARYQIQLRLTYYQKGGR